MKQHDKNIEAEVCKTMSLLDELVPLELHHQFGVRLMHRVEEETDLKYSGFRIDYRLAFMALIFVVNVGTTMLSIQQGDEARTTVSEVPFNQSDDYSNQEFASYDQGASYENLAP